MRPLLILLAFLLVGCSKNEPLSPTPAPLPKDKKNPVYGAVLPQPGKEKVSLISLIANPQKYENHWVITGGYLTLEFEESALYITKDHRDNNLYMDGLWVDLDESLRKKPIINECYVTVHAIFSSTGHGHFGMWPGELRVFHVDEAKLPNLPAPESGE